MTYRFLMPARVEFDEAVDWYEAQQVGLGDDFITEAYAAVQRIVANPQSYATVRRPVPGRDVRVAPIHRFEYLIHYERTASEIVILSVSHGKRGRRLWRQRLPAPPPTAHGP